MTQAQSIITSMIELGRQATRKHCRIKQWKLTRQQIEKLKDELADLSIWGYRPDRIGYMFGARVEQVD